MTLGENRAALTSTEALTDREREVIALLTVGASIKEVAAALGISLNTVRAHIRNIYGKLGLHRRVALAVFAVQHGLALNQAQPRFNRSALHPAQRSGTSPR